MIWRSSFGLLVFTSDDVLAEYWMCSGGKRIEPLAENSWLASGLLPEIAGVGVGFVAGASTTSLCGFSVRLGFAGGTGADDIVTGTAGDGDCFDGVATLIKRTLSGRSRSSEGSRIAFHNIRANSVCKASTTASTSTLPRGFKDCVDQGA